MPETPATPLNGARIWLSGAIPDEASDSRRQALTAFATALAARIFRDGGSIIHGSHPTVLPILTDAARAFQRKGGTRECLTLAASQYFEDQPNYLPGEWEKHATVLEVPARTGENARDTSLADLRLWLAERSDALVAFGGLTWEARPHSAGVPAEFEMARKRGLPCFLVGSLGGAAKRYLNEHPEFLRNLKNGLSEERNRTVAFEANPAALVDLIADQLERLPLVRGETIGGNTFRILALDGGGIRGTFTAAVLDDLEQTTGCKIADHFDLIAGTSTGGILATGFAMGLSAGDMLTFYEKRGPTVFPLTGIRSRAGHLLRYMFRPKYPQAALERELRAAFNKPERDLALRNARCRLVIPACEALTGYAHMFRTNHHPDLTMDADRSAIEVALATAAAPTYFRAASVGGSPYVDGGVWANNPVMAALVEAVARLNVPLNRIDVLSVGTTTDLYSGASTLASGLFGWLWRARILGLMMHVQAHGAGKLAEPLLANVRLLRLDQNVLPGEISLDGPDGIPLLVGYGHGVARDEATVQQVRARFLNGVPAADWERFP